MCEIFMFCLFALESRETVPVRIVCIIESRHDIKNLTASFMLLY